MPVRHALFAKGGLPPLGSALATGINGSISFHKPSGKRWNGTDVVGRVDEGIYELSLLGKRAV
jgi:hypothetical protein